MTIDLVNTIRRGSAYALIGGVLALGVAACDATSTDTNRDAAAPTIDVSRVQAPNDTTVAFNVDVKDNLGIKSVHVETLGGVSTVFDTTFTTAVTNIQIPFALSASRSVPPGTPVLVVASAVDGAGNVSRVDTLRLTVGFILPPVIRVTSPASGTVAVVGKSIVISISGKSGLKVRALGYNATGAVTIADSTAFNSPLADSVSIQDTIAIPANAAPGPLTITPFLRDSLGVRTTGTPITLTVQTVASSNTVPVVNAYCLNIPSTNSCGHSARMEVSDTVHVEATDQTGITVLGYEVRGTPGGPIQASGQATLSGQVTSAIQTFTTSLPYTNFPTTVYLQTFAINSNGTKAYSKLASGADRVDTVTVVAGVTRALPLGGEVADALYHSRFDRIYLSNIARNRVEVFNLADSSFKAPVIVGSRPWGLSAWPRDRDGTMGDTILVANSGGTNISYINLNGGGSGTEVFRYDLPNIIAFSITTTRSAAGILIQQRTKFDFSDRPQYLAATCKSAGGACSEVVLVYSTTPTPGQSVPFTENNGTLRWENLTTRQSHFFFEQAVGQGADRADTLEVIRYDANDNTATILLPFKDPQNRSTVVTVPRLAFRDTTFARNSGNFRRAVFGEGGRVMGSRALSFDVDRGLDPSYPYFDLGVSGSQDVSDFIANSFAQVKGVAINFDGSLSAIRADSTYVLNPALRLQGVIGTTAANAGIDFHPLNTGPNSFPLNTRLSFAASSEPVIEIFDTRCYQRVATIPIRDPVIGPIKAAFRQASGQLVLVAATGRGVVIAQLPNTFTTTCP